MVKVGIIVIVITLVVAGCQAAVTPWQPSAAPAPTAPPTPSPIPTIIPTPTQLGGGSGKLIFVLYKAGFHSTFPELNGTTRVFTSNTDGTGLSLVTDALKEPVYALQAVSPDGKMVLISGHATQNATGSLYLVQLDSSRAEPEALARGMSFWERDAIFIDNSRVIFIGAGPQGNGVYLVDIGGTEPHRIAVHTAQHVRLEAANAERVYWSQVEMRVFKDSYGAKYTWGDYSALYWANLNGTAQGKLESQGSQIVGGGTLGSYAFSPDGTKLAWIPVQTEPDCTFVSLLTTRVRDGSYTRWASEPFRGVYDQFIPFRGQIIRMPWAEAYAKRCYVLYAANVSDLDSPILIPLLPPDRLIAGEYDLDKEYDVMWSPDGSRLLLFHDGTTSGTPPVLLSVNPFDPVTKLEQVKHQLFPSNYAAKYKPLGISPDGQQLLITNLESDSDASFPFVMVTNLSKGLSDPHFIRKIAPGPGSSDQLWPFTMRWLP
jgi:hypothetical protein